MVLNLDPRKRKQSLEAIEETIVRIPGAILRQGGNIVAVLARIGDEIQWPLAKDEAGVKLDDSHWMGRRFSVQEVSETAKKGSEVLDGSVARETSSSDLKKEKKKKKKEKKRRKN
ncbi:protein EARLY-RESPONSIVE TO DEHYDRATION 7, chloroplastic-like [Cannabis sativa]|uniref:protein EARLY-RESPONSIVE TO DEHYDRATION 7, chloroplastic-like n=1 Tax=Cannabis sativa TaxID=3483 RepID=UPI0029CA4CDD|nr:protein EARLY-RESPONSIVE TO DEHYDRATION 7, chloroplastic-like [Cannabis sativa]